VTSQPSELRTIGAQYNLDWLGRQSGHDFDVGASAAMFSFNEPAGTVLVVQGWNITDRQSTLFSPFGAVRQTPIPPTTEFYDGFDRAAGFDLGQIRDRATTRGPDWDRHPNLAFKAFLLRERGREFGIVEGSRLDRVVRADGPDLDNAPRPSRGMGMGGM